MPRLTGPDSERLRADAVASYIAGRSVNEIARELGVSPRAVRHWLVSAGASKALTPDARAVRRRLNARSRAAGYDNVHRSVQFGVHIDTVRRWDRQDAVAQ